MIEIITHYLKFKNGKPAYLCNGELADSKDITNDYHQVSCKDCKLILELDILKIPVKKRTESMHLILIKHFGCVREYLLSMGEFKDVPIDDVEVAKEEISCLLSIDGKCTGNYAPFKCDGIDRPKECQVLEEDKLK